MQNNYTKNKTFSTGILIPVRKMFKNAANRYNTLLTIYFNGYNSIMNKKQEMDKKYDPNNLFLEICKYDVVCKKDEEKSQSKPEKPITERVKLRRQKADDEDLSNIPPLENNEKEQKEEKKLKTLTSNKLLTRISIMLAQTKAQNNSCKLKKKKIKMQILNLLYQHNKITKTVYNNLIKSS